jgi:hypothetical protein
MRFRCRACFLGVLLAMGCGSSTAPDAIEDCSGFGPWQSSPYVLPYPVGAAYFLDQGNCSPAGNGHRGVTRYGYDFLMAIGTPIAAGRGGVVRHVVESHFDGQIAATGFDNFLVIEHDDGTFGLYGHFTHDGIVVDEGERVTAGTLVGYSGNTGNTANKPHLHFSSSSCDTITVGTNNCPTLPVNFRNTDPNPTGLQVGRTYTALPF